MTINTDSPRFIVHEIPDNASEDALKLKVAYNLLKADIEAEVWPYISSECLRLDYNFQDGRILIKVEFTDKNNHKHNFSINAFAGIKITCEYLFEGSVDAPVVSFRSYAAWLMLQLWQYEIGAELCNCDRGITVTARIEEAYEIMTKMLDIVTNNIMPIEWFLSQEPVWGFYETYQDLQKMLPLLQAEASAERWKNVKPENFRLIRSSECALICLDYTDCGKYTMEFRVGLAKNGFGAERPDKFMDMFYRFENHSKDIELSKYFDEENREFSEMANLVLNIPFKWKAIFAHADDGFYISTYRKFAFQKFCLMLDCIIPLKDHYKASKPFISSEIQETKRQFEAALSTEFDFVDDQEADFIFTHGFYIAEPDEEEDNSEECPF